MSRTWAAAKVAATTQRSLLVRDGDRSGRLLVKCFAGCPPTSILAVFRSVSKLEHRQHTRAPSSKRLAAPERQSTEERTRQAEVIWNRSRESGATLATTYLNKRRGLDLNGLDLNHCLRWDDARRCLVGKMTDPLTGVMTGVHRTFLDCEGRKLRRAMLGRKGVVRLTPDKEVTFGLAITEGIEDALSVIVSGAGPAWSACDAGGVERFPILAGIDVLTILQTVILAAGVRLRREPALVDGVKQEKRRGSGYLRRTKRCEGRQ